MRKCLVCVPLFILAACEKPSAKVDRIFAEVNRLEAQAAVSSYLEAYRLYNDALNELQRIPSPGFLSKAGEIIEARKNSAGNSLRLRLAEARDGAFTDAATKGEIKTLAHLLDEGCQPNGGRPDPAVQRAIEAGQLETVKFLVQRKADPLITHSMLNLAVEHWQPDIIQYIYEQTHTGDCNLLRVAIERGDLKLAKLIIDTHPEFISQPCGALGNTPLWEAARKGDAGLLKSFLTKTGKIDSNDYRTRNHSTPLEIAAQKGNSNVVEILKAAGEVD